MTTEDVLECLGLLTQYLTPPTERGHVALGYKDPMRFAMRLLHVWMTKKDGRELWILPKHWQRRLERVGVDPKTFQVIDQGRWNIAWDQWRQTETFKLELQNIAINQGTIAPPSTPIIDERWVMPKQKRAPNPRTNPDDDEFGEDESPYTTVMRRSIKRVLNR